MIEALLKQYGIFQELLHHVLTSTPTHFDRDEARLQATGFGNECLTHILLDPAKVFEYYQCSNGPLVIFGVDLRALLLSRLLKQRANSRRRLCEVARPQ